MTIVPACDNENPAEGSCAAVPARAIVVLVAGMAAAWFAAGSTGLVAHSLQHALTWLALAVALVAAWPENIRRLGTWAILAVGVILGLLFTASAIPTINVLAVAVVLAGIAQVHRGLTARVALIAALGATALACYRFACTSIPTVWLAADGLGWALGRAAGWLAGSQLEVGATFGGIDFLVLTAAIYAGWIIYTVPPRRPRALWAVAAIIIGHFAYLIVLAYSEKLLAALPAVVPPPRSDTSRVGLSLWTNGLRTLIPWNVPLLALLIHGGIVAAMVASSPWTPIIEIDPEALKRQRAREEKEELPGSALLKGLVFQFGPALLAVAAILSGALTIIQPNLQGKKIVAYEKGSLNWLKPEYDSSVDGLYGMLPVFVESLGGRFVKSKELSPQDLAGADVLLLIHPDQPWPKETLDRIWDYVRGGGSLLLVAEPAIREGKLSSSFNDVLQPLSMNVHFDTAIARAGYWEQSYEIMSHPATAGLDDLRNRFGMRSGSTIRTNWPASPTLVGQWGWSEPGNDAAASGASQYNAGERLGDLVLAAEQPLGHGRVFVLGDTSPLRNDGLPNAFPFDGSLLSYLAHRPSSPQVLWRQLCTLAALLATVGLLAGRPAAWQVMLTSTVMAVSLVSCTVAAYWTDRVLPDSRSISMPGGNRIAYIDASHVEAYDSDSRGHGVENHGISEFLLTLMRQGYLPLLAPDLAPDRLERCRLLVSIAPARPFTPVERETVKEFVGNGGVLLCIVGAEESRANAPLLAEFDLRVPPSPVRPDEDLREPEPLSEKRKFGLTPDGNAQGPFYTMWPVESSGENPAKMLVYWARGGNQWSIVAQRSYSAGSVVVIGDTYFASNENFNANAKFSVRFWRWLLSSVVRGETPWKPPAVTNADLSNSAEEEDEEDSE
jgi:hypothetical protein